METRTRVSVFELLHHERYTADEVARRSGLTVDIVRHAAFSGELPAGSWDITSSVCGGKTLSPGAKRELAPVTPRNV